MTKPIHIALLRGINVGGRNKLPMKGLAELFASAGCSDVRTYIQSGNVLYRAAPALARKVPGLLSEAIEDQFGFRVPVITRTVKDFGKVVLGNPFLRAGVDSRVLHVGFLAKRPNATRVAALDPDRSPPDEFVVDGREVYLHCPNGVARTKLTNSYFDRMLSTTSTFRTWNTILKLIELAEKIRLSPAARGS